MNFNISKNVPSAIFAQSAQAWVRNSAIGTAIIFLLVFAGFVQAAGDAEWNAGVNQVNNALRQLRQACKGDPGCMQYSNQAEKLWKQAQAQWAMQQRYQQQNMVNQTRTQLLAQQQNLMNQLLKQQQFLQQQLVASKTPELKTINPFGDYGQHGVSLHPKDGRLHGLGTIADTPELSGLFRQPDMNAKEGPGMQAWKEAMRQLDSISGGSSSSGALGLKDGSDDGLRPGGTSFFGLGGGPGPGVILEPLNDPMVVDLRHQGLADDATVKLFDPPEYPFESMQTKPPPDPTTPATDEGHGLVIGTTETYAFKWPKECDAKCTKDIELGLAGQLKLYCKSQKNPNQCLQDGLPFTKESYDMVVSMANAHTAIQDLATRVVWDGQSFGEFSRQNALIFGSLKGRHFDTLDCHSNGAMLCLAALRSGDTTAEKVRLFGPQINAQAAERWREWANSNGTEIEIYINNGDPIPAISWKQPTPQTTVGKAATAAWLTNPFVAPAILADALMDTWIDSKSATMDEILRYYGFKVKRFYPPECNSPDIKCHSMLLYEKNTSILPR